MIRPLIRKPVSTRRGFVVAGEGMAAVVSGRHAGEIGYCDGEGDRIGWARIYFGAPWVTPATSVRLVDLRPATVREMSAWRRRMAAALRLLGKDLDEIETQEGTCSS